jgi:4-hydroxybenzoate polyprenyltransferase
MIRIFRIAFYGSRPFIALHYLFPTAFGIFLGMKVFTRPSYVLDCVLIFLSVFFSFQTSIILNDINDLRADAISKRRTPLNTREISIKEYQNIAILCLCVSLILAYLISYRTLLIVILGHILHFSYSSKPFRLKRYYPLSIFMLALGALLAAVAGHSLYEPSKPFLSFPLKSAILIVVPLFLALNFRDLADYEGDRQTDTNTLFTIIGLEKGKRVNALFIFLSYLCVPMIINYPLLFLSAVPLGLISGFLCLQKPFQEKHVFYAYFVFITILTILFNLKPEIIIK